jgi:hypothetical protein
VVAVVTEVVMAVVTAVDMEVAMVEEWVVDPEEEL